MPQLAVVERLSSAGIISLQSEPEGGREEGAEDKGPLINCSEIQNPGHRALEGIGRWTGNLVKVLTNPAVT